MKKSEVSDIQKKYKERTNFIYLEVGFYFLLSFSFIGLFSYFFDRLNIGLLVAFYLLSIAVIGWCQFSLSNALHEGVHKNFGKKHNEYLSRILTAYPIGFTMKSVRVPHWDHHRYFGIKGKDPDYEFYSGFPQTKWSFIRRFIYNLSGISALRQFYNQVFQQSVEKEGTGVGNESGERDFEFVYLILTQCVILTFFLLVFSDLGIIRGGIAYVALWIIPLATVAKFCSSTRLLCEHGSPDNELVFRTITGNIFQTNQLGAFRFNFHAEHHIIPSIPYHRLRDAKDDIKGEISEERIRYESFNGGYLRLILKWFVALPAK